MQQFKQHVFSFLRQSSLLACVGVLVPTLALGVLSGCAIQRAEVSEDIKKAKLLNQPVVDKRLSTEDFGFPSEPPKLTRGKEVYQKNCLSCHAVQQWQSPEARTHLAYTTPIDVYLMLSSGASPAVVEPTTERKSLGVKNHPVFREALTRDDRWAVLFYVRHLAGNSDMHFASRDGKPLDVASIFGGNCAVCHGKRGFADGPLHLVSHPSSHEFKAGSIHSGAFQPPPANFHEYKRVYNRTDAQLFKYIAEGIYPSGMPAWLGNVDKEYNFAFDDTLLWMLVRHIRSFAYNNDLADESVPPGPVLPRPTAVQPLIPPVRPLKVQQAAVGEVDVESSESSKPASAAHPSGKKG